MSYEVHNFMNGEVIRAEPANEMDQKIKELDGLLEGTRTEEIKTSVPAAPAQVGGVQASVGSPIAFSTSTSYRYLYYDVNPSNDISFTVKTKQSTSVYYPKYVHYTDRNGIVLAAYGEITETDQEVTYADLPVPRNAERIYVTYYGTFPEYVEVSQKYYGIAVPGIVDRMDTIERDVLPIVEEFDEFSEQVEEIIASVGEIKHAHAVVQPENVVQGGVTGNVGFPISRTTTSSYYNMTVDVDPEAISYHIKTKQSTSSNYLHYFWFLNENNVIVLAGGQKESTEGFYEYDTEIPDGAKYLVVLTLGTIGNAEVSKEVIKTISGQLEVIDKYFEKKGVSQSPYADQLKDAGRPVVFDHNFSKKYLNFAFITDTHFGGTRYPEFEARNNIRAFVEMANERWVDFAVHGGDIITDYGLSRNDALQWFDDTLGIFGDIQVPLLIAKGNHEANNAYYSKVTDTTQLDWDHVTYYVRSGISFASITQSQWDGEQDLYVENLVPERIPDNQFTMLAQLGFAGDDVVRNPADYMGGYFYKDFAYNKIRVIVLNEYQIQGTTWAGMTAEQVAWLGGTALVLGNDKADYSVMIISHSPNASSAVSGLINAFKNGTSYTTGGHTYDFSGQGAKTFIMYLHGHEHLDTYLTSGGFNNIGVICGFVAAGEVGSANEIRFSIFTIDTDNRKIYETRIGAGNSREFDY